MSGVRTRIAVASGKGGTGKTVVATSLAWLLAEQGRRVTYVDADVEEPNGALFLHPEIGRRDEFTVLVPRLREGTCSGCGACQRHCAFHAIVALSDRVLTFPELCHACGVCQRVCEEQALIEVPRAIGTLDRGTAAARTPLAFRDGRLHVGEARSTPMIEALVAQPADTDVMVVDSPPGTSCAAMAATGGADLVLLVTEPTPFGLHDLRLSVEMNRRLGNRVAALINRADLGDDEVEAYLRDEGLEVLARVPFLEGVSQAYVHGRVAAAEDETFRGLMEDVLARLPLQEAP